MRSSVDFWSSAIDPVLRNVYGNWPNMPSVGPGGARIWRVDVRASLEGRVYYRIGPVYRSCPRERGALNFLAVAASLRVEGLMNYQKHDFRL